MREETMESGAVKETPEQIWKSLRGKLSQHRLEVEHLLNNWDGMKFDAKECVFEPYVDLLFRSSLHNAGHHIHKDEEDAVVDFEILVKLYNQLENDIIEGESNYIKKQIAVIYAFKKIGLLLCDLDRISKGKGTICPDADFQDWIQEKLCNEEWEDYLKCVDANEERMLYRATAQGVEFEKQTITPENIRVRDQDEVKIRLTLYHKELEAARNMEQKNVDCCFGRGPYWCELIEEVINKLFYTGSVKEERRDGVVSAEEEKQDGVNSAEEEKQDGVNSAELRLHGWKMKLKKFSLNYEKMKNKNMKNKRMKNKRMKNKKMAAVELPKDEKMESVVAAEELPKDEKMEYVVAAEELPKDEKMESVVAAEELPKDEKMEYVVAEDENMESIVTAEESPEQIWKSLRSRLSILRPEMERLLSNWGMMSFDEKECVFEPYLDLLLKCDILSGLSTSSHHIHKEVNADLEILQRLYNQLKSDMVEGKRNHLKFQIACIYAKKKIGLLLCDLDRINKGEGSIFPDADFRDWIREKLQNEDWEYYLKLVDAHEGNLLHRATEEGVELEKQTITHENIRVRDTDEVKIRLTAYHKELEAAHNMAQKTMDCIGRVPYWFQLIRKLISKLSGRCLVEPEEKRRDGGESAEVTGRTNGGKQGGGRASLLLDFSNNNYV